MARVLVGMYKLSKPFSPGSVVSDLVLVKSVAVGKTPRQTLPFDRLLYLPHIAWARCHHYKTESTNRASPPFPIRDIVLVPGPFSRDKIWEWPGNEATIHMNIMCKIIVYHIAAVL